MPPCRGSLWRCDDGLRSPGFLSVESLIIEDPFPLACGQASCWEQRNPSHQPNVHKASHNTDYTLMSMSSLFSFYYKLYMWATEVVSILIKMNRTVSLMHTIMILSKHVSNGKKMKKKTSYIQVCQYLTVRCLLCTYASLFYLCHFPFLYVKNGHSRPT